MTSPFYCQFCGSSWSTEQTLKEHERNCPERPKSHPIDESVLLMIVDAIDNLTAEVHLLVRQAKKR